MTEIVQFQFRGLLVAAEVDEDRNVWLLDDECVVEDLTEFYSYVCEHDQCSDYVYGRLCFTDEMPNGATRDFWRDKLLSEWHGDICDNACLEAFPC